MTTPTQTGDYEDVTILMTGAGAPGASGIIRSLRSVDERAIRIVGVDMDPDAYGFGLVDEHYTVPAGSDEEYVRRIADIATVEDVDVVLPLTTDELQPLAADRDAVPATVMVSDPEGLRAANDKAALYDFLATNGFDAAPDFRRVADEASFVEAVEALGYPDRPVCFKPTVASGMRGFRVLDEGTDRVTRLLDEKPGEAVTTLEEVRPVLSEADPFPDLVVMEYLPGEEYSVDLLAMDDEVGPVVPRTRSRTRAGITFQGIVEDNEPLIEEATAISKQLGLEYNINLQFKYDADGTPKIIEINPRVSGTIIMCVGAGANLPYLGVKYALDESIPPVDVRWGTQMTRYWNELFRSPDGRTFHVTEETTGPKTGL
ncbi:ATP-grasp domain-containing protein [Halodesulfurarchaeum formicicum]|uniref:Carbamoyl phosphate synthase large subunit n=1 Tax=Halodesulfurarchaeum formicicum TaxID=1873524 RepID=A0A1J1AAD3_9EURY|nr:ATP-grasp domain-containing protein [Halodesulfurarchaeum formicicum]APE95102.1 carbamoyl phosphate synthase large subunit [Halodesulfurarchaeum formicicum]